MKVKELVKALSKFSQEEEEEEYFISKPESENDRDNIADLKKQVSNLEKQVAELIEQAFRQSEFRERMWLAVQDGDRNDFR